MPGFLAMIASSWRFARRQWHRAGDVFRILTVTTLAASALLAVAAFVVFSCMWPPLNGNEETVMTVKIDKEQFDEIKDIVENATEWQADISSEIAGIRFGVEDLRSEAGDVVVAIREQGDRIADGMTAITEQTGKISDDVAAIAEQTGRIADGVAAVRKGGDRTLQEEDEVSDLQNGGGILTKVVSSPEGCSDSDGCLGELYFVHDWPPERENICKDTAEGRDMTRDFSQTHITELGSIVDKLKEKGPGKFVLVEGYASNHGEKEFVEGPVSNPEKEQNLMLSRRRAEIVACYLEQELMNRNGESKYCFSHFGEGSDEHWRSHSDSDDFNYRKVRVILSEYACPSGTGRI